jgi:DNA mismatch repair protein MutL
MAKIRILPEHVVNQIAAGEVVERASSVLKELIENAIDAGSQRIQIIIKGSGRELIQVIDDGCGMSREDMQLAFERHATSKLTRTEDLYSIHTLGFRGEALPSIASVSFVELRSAVSGSPSGGLLRLEAGTIVHDGPVAAPPGTAVSVHSLFYNTPARARFLKSTATELAHLVRIFKQYALAHPDISWTFVNENVTEYSLPATDLLARVESIFGAGISEKVLSIDYEQAGIHVTGVVGMRELNKKSRGDQFFFLNRRPIQSAFLHTAVKAAMREYIDEGEWPFYVLFLELDPSQFDVNVHPSKLEVKFVDDKLVHAVLYRTIRHALPEEIPPDLGAGSPSSAFTSSSDSTISREADLFVRRNLESLFPPAAESAPGLSAPSAADNDLGRLFRPAIHQVHNKYLISQVRSGIAVIDQHAAHERILYEKALRSFRERAFNAQQLLFPILLELEPEEDAVFQEVRADMLPLGFQIRDFGPRTYSIEAVPAGLKRAAETDMVHALLQEYSEFRQANFAPRDALAAGFACKAAIRAGDELTPDERTALIDELFATEFPLTCPHGRPTVIHIRLTELDRRFKRID